MTYVAPNARSFESERPLTIVAIACSRIPKWSILPRGFVRGRKVCRPAEEPGDALREHVEHFAGGFPARNALGVRWKDREVAIPPIGQVPPLHLIDLRREVGILDPVRPEELAPSASSRGAARADAGGEV